MSDRPEQPARGGDTATTSRPSGRPSGSGRGASRGVAATGSSGGTGEGRTASPSGAAGGGSGKTRPAPASQKGATRKARLRLTRLDPWSVMKTAFLLSIALGITLVVAVTIVFGVLGAAGVWDAINSSVQQIVGGDNDFDVTEYVGLRRVLGFTVLVAVADVVLLTAVATLAAFLYDLSAALLGGIEVTLAEDDR